MQVTSIKTHKITEKDTTIFAILDRYLPKIQERSIVAITSKIISICEGRIVPFIKAKKDDLIVKESNYYIPRNENLYKYFLTITHNAIYPAAGIDESNANNNFILLPENPQMSANKIRTYLSKRFNVENVGVIITDSKTIPLRWGQMGILLAHSGFSALNDYRHTPDLFGREMKIKHANIAEALAVAAVLEMGEGVEQTPMAIIKDVPYVAFQKRSPSKKELALLYPDVHKDLYSSVILKAKWRKGKKL